jgi:hypothetical protein
MPLSVHNCVDSSTQTDQPVRTIRVAHVLRRKMEKRMASSPAPVRASASNGAQNGNASLTDVAARRIFEACKRVDSECRVTYVSVDEQGRTTVRIRAGIDASVTTLQRTLRELMPLAKVRTSENPLDGTLQAQITTTSRRDEYAIARARTEKNKWLRALRVLAATCVVMGVAMFATLPLATQLV